ncbi:helix-turn-helix transcriptional regulator [Leifsonia xyli]|uniref:helix-turn-helix transcriptional regulator n=1 Tax=Leifsonia xyli TaxID=1575 RepID=UPI003D67AE46
MNLEPQLPQLLASKTVASHLGVSQSTLSRLRKEGDGPAFVMIRGCARYRPESVEAWIAAEEGRASVA